MTKTLADMTAEERADCIGLWAQLSHGELAIIADTGTTHMSWLNFPRRAGDRTVYANKHVTLRYDLPRAWTPDGEPVPGEWEDGHVFVSYDEPDPWIVKDTVSIEGLSEGGMSYYEEPPNGIVVKLDRFGEGEGKARRWVGEWQKTNE